MSDSLQPRGLQHARPPCPSLSPGVCPSSCSWVGAAITPSHPLPPSSPFAFSLFQDQGLFPMSRLFPSDGQSTGASASALVLPMSIQGWFPLGWTGLIFLLYKWLSFFFKFILFFFCTGDFQESSPASQFESINSSVLSLPYGPNRTSIDGYWKDHSFGPYFTR